MEPYRSSNSESGLYIVFLSFFVLAIIALAFLVIGLGYLSSDSVRMQQITDLAALATIEEYIAQGNNSSVPAASPRAVIARDRANQILSQNKILGVSAPLGDLALPWETGLSGGTVTFGSWYPETSCTTCPTPSPPPCGGAALPCFDANGPIVNSVRVSVNNQASNPIILPLANLLGHDPVSLSAQSTASLVQRCTAYLLDVSVSSTEETHEDPYIIPSPSPGAFAGTAGMVVHNYPSPWPAPCTSAPSPLPSHPSYYKICPYDRQFGLFAMRKYNLRRFAASPEDALAPLSPLYSTLCNVNANGIFGPSNSPSIDGLVWCNTLFDDTGNFKDRTDLNDPGIYRQDYKDMPSPYGWVRVDTHTDPQPLSNFLLAFNAGLRSVAQYTTAGDFALIMAFASDIRARYPNPSPGQSGVTSDMQFLIQITNTNYRPLLQTLSPTLTYSQAKHPNFIDMGFFPLHQSMGDTSAGDTHAVKAIATAMDSLELYCPASSRKSIILATDGIMTCATAGAYSYSGSVDCPGIRDFSVFSAAQSQLLDGSPGSTLGILRKLIDRRISLSVILTGSGIEPNVRNILEPDGHYRTIEEAVAMGDYNFFNPDAEGTGIGPAEHDKAFLRYGEPGVKFRLPNRVFGELAMRTGGEFCPLMHPCDMSLGDCAACSSGASCYECPDGNTDGVSGCFASTSSVKPKIRNCARQNGPYQTCALEKLSVGEQAAKCALNATGRNPFILVHGN